MSEASAKRYFCWRYMEEAELSEIARATGLSEGTEKANCRGQWQKRVRNWGEDSEFNEKAGRVSGVSNIADEPVRIG